jgi:hypothetical protein
MRPMGAPTSDVGYASATTSRGGGVPRNLYGHVVALEEKNQDPVIVLLCVIFRTD